MNLTDTPIRSDRQAGHCAAASSQHSAVERCWADGGHSELIRQVTVECQALGTGRLGLCPKHAKEICGE